MDKTCVGEKKDMEKEVKWKANPAWVCFFALIGGVYVVAIMLQIILSGMSMDAINLWLRQWIASAQYLLCVLCMVILMLGENLTKPGTFDRIKAVFPVLLMAPVVWIFGVPFLIFCLLCGYLLSGGVLLRRARESPKGLALLVFALILILVPWLITLPTVTTLAISIDFITLLTFLGRVVVFWGVMDVARDLIFPLAETRCYGGRPHSYSTLAITATVAFVVLFGLSLFTQEMDPVYFTGGFLFSMTVESKLPDFLFVAGVVMAALKLVAGHLRKIFQS